MLEWKAALEEALASAPSADPVTTQIGVSRNDQGNAVDHSSEQCKLLIHMVLNDVNL